MRRDVEEALKRFRVETFGNKKKLIRFEEILRNDEVVQYISPTRIKILQNNTWSKTTLTGICALTTKRFIFQYRFWGITNIENIFLDKIDSVNCSGNSWNASHIQIHAVSKTYDIICSYKKEIMKEIQNTFENTIYNYSLNKDKNINENSEGLNNIDEIKKYKELLDMGAITQEEFETKKKEFLGG